MMWPMRSGLAVLPLVVACSFHSADAVDAAISGDTPDACVSFSHQFDTCSLGFSGDMNLAGGAYAYNTDTDTLTLAGVATPSPPSRQVFSKGGAIRVWLVDTFELGQTSSLRVDGQLPFGVAATGPITIAGIIDATAGGAGAQMSCAASNGAVGAAQGGGAGGGGGAGSQGSGGTGGAGNSDGSHGNGGPPGVMLAPLPRGPIGGCPGGHGGLGEDPGGVAGTGGGGVYLVSRAQLTILGTINAGGGGGKGATTDNNGNSDGGGGGGGSGGMILVECSSTSISGTLAANGGGGGQGGGDGESGNDGTTGGADEIPPAGGHGTSSGTDGGNGGAGTMLAGASVPGIDLGGGGGGGGGAGFVIVDASQPQLSGVISPPPIPLPP